MAGYAEGCIIIIFRCKFRGDGRAPQSAQRYRSVRPRGISSEETAGGRADAEEVARRSRGVIYTARGRRAGGGVLETARADGRK